MKLKIILGGEGTFALILINEGPRLPLPPVEKTLPYDADEGVGGLDCLGDRNA